MTSATIGNSAYQSLSNQQLSEIDEFCDRFDLELAKRDGRSIESFLAEAPEESHGGLLAEAQLAWTRATKVRGKIGRMRCVDLA